QSLMRSSGLDFTALDLIAVTTGPGTFTGQRVGLAFARALRVALNKPAIGVTTLDCLAEEALVRQPRPWAIAAADAKREEIYLGARSARGETLIAPELIARDMVAARLSALANLHGNRVALAGTAAEAVAPLLAEIGWQCTDSLVRQPDAIFVAGLVAAEARAGVHDPIPPPPKPLYLRAPDAKLPGRAL
ncbi:MAG TPA: tRNA (adenosine(37)-N6)-threonylcarbamoyltransferase complex dimerization subunit type 1 TsaB, partial [Micropepsaceae bacterium]